MNRKSTPPVPERRRLEYAEAVKQQPIRQQNCAGSRNPEMVKPTYNWKSTTLEDGLFSGDPAASWTLEDELRKSKQIVKGRTVHLPADTYVFYCFLGYECDILWNNAVQ